MKKLFKYLSVFSFLILSPIVTLAQFVGPCPQGYYNNGLTCVPFSGLSGLIYNIKGILNSIIPLLIALGVVYFIWGVITYYILADGEEAKKKGKDKIVYGLIGFAVIAGLWGLVNIVTKTFLPDGANAPQLVSLTGTSAGCTAISGTSNVKDVLCYITKLINDSVIPLIFAVATAMFVWGAVKFFIINSDEESKRAQGRQFMVWGIIALTVMLSVWGLVSLLSNTFGISGGGSVLPQVRPPNSSNQQ